MRNFLLTITFLFAGLALCGQTNISVDASKTYQTFQGWGASDAWNTDWVGKYWSTSTKEEIAKLLFSTEVDQNGNPLGIGLSRWRFNIGGGSAEQGEASNIEHPERRSECFLLENGTYDWTKQSGQQYFLNKASEYGVNQLVAFVNSPPRFYTKNGRANSDNQNRFGSTNLASDKYDEFAEFIATVLKHFADEGLEFAHISPVNEPQYEWSSGQEGCPYTNAEIKTLIDNLNPALVNKGLSTKILMAEAAKYSYIYQTEEIADKSNHMDEFFKSTSNNYVGDYSHMLPGIACHSYWLNGSDSEIRSVRETTYNKAQALGIEVYQTEYNLLDEFASGESDQSKFDNALFLAKIIHADLTITNVSLWDYWTAIERERWSQANRFYLIKMEPTGGPYVDLLNTGGTVSTDKNLWAYGNFTRFIRPNYQRVDLTGADNLGGLMGSAFISPDKDELVMVFVNNGSSSNTISTNFAGLAGDITIITPYVTDISNDLVKQTNITANDNYTIPAKSIVTLVCKVSTCDESAITANIEVNDQASTQTVSVDEGDKVELLPSVTDAGTWSWTGPNGFTSDQASVTINSFAIEDIGDYTGTFTNNADCKSTVTYSIDVEGYIPSPFKKDHAYYIGANSDTTVVWGVTGESTQSTANIETNIKDVNKADYHNQFLIEAIEEGIYKITNENSGLALALPNGNTDNGASLLQETYQDNDRFKWEIVESSGAYKVINIASGRCSDLWGGTLDGTADVATYDCGSNINPNHLWKIFPVNPITTSVNDLEIIDLNIYPNPTTNTLNFDIDVDVEIEIVTIDGKILYSDQAPKTLDVSDWENGLYFVICKSSDNKCFSTQKIIINK